MSKFFQGGAEKPGEDGSSDHKGPSSSSHQDIAGDLHNYEQILYDSGLNISAGHRTMSVINLSYDQQL